MFSFRRKNSKTSQEAPIRTSPSLPQLATGGIPWPESLVDVNSIRENGDEQGQGPTQQPQQGATKSSLPSTDSSPISFHKPFRSSPGKNKQGSNNGPPISSLYMHDTNPVDESWRTAPPPSANKFSQRRATRVPPTFNLMVAGGQGTGKTSLLRLLLETADISPTATLDQRAAVDRFLRGYPKATQNISTACVEICESRYDRILFSVIDSPGLDFIEGRELKLERQVSSIVKYIDAQYSDTLSEESKVVRKSKGDQHIHLCIYLIDPNSVISVAARRAQSSLPAKTRSETTVSQRNPPDLVPDTSSGDDSDDEEERITMSLAEIRVIKRLAGRVNILPIVAHADSLTDDKLKAVKEAVRQDLHDAGVDFGVFGSAMSSRGRQNNEAETPKRKTRFQSKPRQSNGDGTTNGTHEPSDPSSPTSPGSGGDGAESDDEERASRPVIKLRPRHPSQRTLSRSRSRRDLHQAAHDESRPVSPDNESIANVRFSAHIVAKVDLSNIMPFAIIAPEMKRAHRHLASDGVMPRTAPSSPVQQSEDGHASIVNGDTLDPPFTAASTMSRNLAYLDGPVEDLKGVFTRKFRWGTVDVLNPDHCDFAALRTAVMSTHLKVLKTHTKEVLYEKYRTEKLLARRATRQITDDERKRLLEDLGL